MRAYTLGATIIGGFLLAGCTGDGTVYVNGTLADSVALDGARKTGTTIELDAPSGVLAIERARIAVSEVELEGEEDGDEEFEMGAAVVEIALDASTTEIVADAVTAGTYQQLGLEFMIANGGEGPAFADFGAGPASILVDGTFEDTPFTYRSGVAPEIEFTLGMPLVVPEGGEARVAVTFDVPAWFLGAGGAVLDPSDPANRATIENNILSSMAAYAEIEMADDD